MTKPKVMIAVPTMGRTFTNQIKHFLDTAKYTKGLPVEFEDKFVNDKKPIPAARNALVKMFLESDCTSLWFVDSDVVPSENVFDLLVEPHPIRAGIYPVLAPKYERGKVPLWWTMYERQGDKYAAIQPSEKWEEVDAAGTGMMIISRAVFADPQMELPGGNFFKETYNEDGSIAMSDDINFCERAKEAGYPIWVDSRIQCGHIKPVDTAYISELMSVSFEIGRTRAAC